MNVSAELIAIGILGVAGQSWMEGVIRYQT